MQIVLGEIESCGLEQPLNNCALFPGRGLLFWKTSHKVTQQFIWLQSRSSRPPGLSPSAAALPQSEHFKSLYCLFTPSQIVLCAADERLSANKRFFYLFQLFFSVSGGFFR